MTWATLVQVGCREGKSELESGHEFDFASGRHQPPARTVESLRPHEFSAGVCPRHFTGGGRHALSAVQLWRTHLLAVLTSTHSLNLLVAQLTEQVAWRRFARLRRTLPTARMLHEFRQTVGVAGLRAINHHLVGRLLRRTGLQPHAVAL